MKKSSVVALVISGALFAGCDSSDDSATSWEDSQTYTNNHYAAGRGYYHAPFHAWYPFPYNYHDPARGYFHGGTFRPDPHVSKITASQPAARSSTSRSSSSSSSVKRGGFSSSHFSSGSS